MRFWLIVLVLLLLAAVPACAAPEAASAPEPSHHSRRGMDDEPTRAAWLAGLAEIEGEHVVLRLPADRRDDPQMRRLAAELDRAAAAMAPRVPVALDRPLTVAVEEDHVAQGRHTGQIGPAVVSREPATAEVHLVYHPDDGFSYRFALAWALVRRGLPGLPPWLERGAALSLAGDWYGRPYRQWLPLFAAAGVLPAPDELLAAEIARDASDLLWTPAAAAVVAGQPGATLAEKLESPPAAGRVARVLSEIGPSAAAAAEARLPPRPPFWHGVSFAMANGLEIGYHAPVIRPALDRLDRLGSDAVSLMPFAFQRHPEVPELAYLSRSPSSETDVGMVHAARAAHRRGMTVLWKPQIWLPDSWPGEIRMRSEEAWAAWWRGYRRFILHHAFLARWADARILSVGVELGATLEREREWRELIAAARLLFPGELTYAGNWYGDAEKVPFWPLLNYVGVDAYYPLSGSAEADGEALSAGAREVRGRLAALARRHGRPLLLTEVGFAAHEAAWQAPHEEGGPLSVEDQARSYEALFGALGKPSWLAGVFVWKSFSHEVDGPAGERPDFRFLGRPAERVVERYFAAKPAAAAGGR